MLGLGNAAPIGWFASSCLRDPAGQEILQSNPVRVWGCEEFPLAIGKLADFDICCTPTSRMSKACDLVIFKAVMFFFPLFFVQLFARSRRSSSRARIGCGNMNLVSLLWCVKTSCQLLPAILFCRIWSAVSNYVLTKQSNQLRRKRWITSWPTSTSGPCCQESWWVLIDDTLWDNPCQTREIKGGYDDNTCHQMIIPINIRKMGGLESFHYLQVTYGSKVQLCLGFQAEGAAPFVLMDVMLGMFQTWFLWRWRVSLAFPTPPVFQAWSFCGRQESYPSREAAYIQGKKVRWRFTPGSCVDSSLSAQDMMRSRNQQATLLGR